MMKKLNLIAIATTMVLLSITAQADTFSLVVKWKNQADYQAAFDTPKQRVLRAKQAQKSASNTRVATKTKTVVSPMAKVSDLSGYALEHVRSGANRTDTYTVEADSFDAAKQALMATGYFEYVSPNTFYKSEPIKFVAPSKAAKSSGAYQAQGLETYAFNDPYFSQQVVFQPQGNYTMGAGNFLAAMDYVAANKQLSREVRVAVAADDGVLD